MGGEQGAVTAGVFPVDEAAADPDGSIARTKAREVSGEDRPLIYYQPCRVTAGHENATRHVIIAWKPEALR
jgi:hypothetical protein